MVAPITFRAEVDKSRRLTLPDDVSLGPVEVIILRWQSLSTTNGRLSAEGFSVDDPSDHP